MRVERSKMKSGIIALGMILAIVGIIVLVLGIVAVPFTTTKFEEVPHSNTWLNESFIVPAGNYYYYYGTFAYGVSLHITFSVTAGGNKDINFKAMDETDYLKMKAGDSYEYYSIPSRDSVSSVDIYWNPPSSQKIYFVFDNTFSVFTSKSISAYFTTSWTEMENRQITENRTLLPSVHHI